MNYIVADKAKRHEITLERLRELKPRYVFFPHWSWTVPQAMTSEFECVGFHMTDLPYGRGGSPLQNLILNGHTKTMVSALRMTAEIDCGPIYAKRPLSLAGPAHEIYKRCRAVVDGMIAEIVRDEPKPIAQTKGEYEMWERRTPEMSRLPKAPGNTRDIYDFIRMLDADAYPRAFIKTNGLTFELSDAHLDGDTLTAKATLK